jgi:hypothetical protein
LFEAHEVGEENAGDGPVANDQHVVRHAFDLKYDFAKAIDDVEIWQISQQGSS